MAVQSSGKGVRIRRQDRKGFIRARLRRKHLQRLLCELHGGRVPDSDPASYVLTAAECYGNLARAAKRPVTAEALAANLNEWCGTWAPTFGGCEIDAICERVAKLEGWLPPDDHIGVRLSLRDVDRTRLKITTIGCCDLDPETREQRRRDRKRERDREHARTKRAAKGAVSREQWLADHSLSKTKPWEALGISRRTYERRERRRKAAMNGTVVGPSLSLLKV
jgi:hypothetical protein